MDFEEYLKTRNKKEFARLLGISTRSLTHYIKGNRLPALDVAEQIERISEKRVRPKDFIKKWREKNG